MNKTIHSEPSRLLTRWLRTCRKQKGLSMRALAARLHVPHSWIGKIEQGERRLDVVEYVRLCLALETDPRKGIGRLAELVRPDFVPSFEGQARRTAEPTFPAVPKAKLYDQDISALPAGAIRHGGLQAGKLSVAESSKGRSPWRRRAAESTASLRPDAIRDRGGVAAPYPTAPRKRRERKA